MPKYTYQTEYGILFKKFKIWIVHRGLYEKISLLLPTKLIARNSYCLYIIFLTAFALRTYIFCIDIRRYVVRSDTRSAIRAFLFRAEVGESTRYPMSTISAKLATRDRAYLADIIKREISQRWRRKGASCSEWYAPQPRGYAL